jgi:hypothetical protein
MPIGSMPFEFVANQAEEQHTRAGMNVDRLTPAERSGYGEENDGGGQGEEAEAREEEGESGAEVPESTVAGAKGQLGDEHRRSRK